MACCTTIPPLNSNNGQKRSSGGIFDLPKSAKRRRPFSSTSVTTLNSTLLMSPSSKNSMLNNNSALSVNKPVIIDASDENKNKNLFHTANISFFNQPGSSLSSSSSNISSFSAFNTNQQQQTDNQNQLMERIKHEAKRLMKRRQLSDLTTVHTGSTNIISSPSCVDDTKSSQLLDNLSCSPKKISSSSSSSSLIIPNTSSSSLNTSINNFKHNLSANDTTKPLLATVKAKSHNDLPLFSMNQVNQICSGMIRERELLIREQYDKILAEKLSEQYDSFVKFTHDQIKRRFENSQCSYVS
jgi:hypothetical protein